MATEPSQSAGNSDQRRPTDLLWAQVVKGADSEPPITQHDENLDAANANNVVDASADVGSASADAAVTKKPAWSKPSNGVVGGPVMGADSWPALSESTRVSPKSLSSSSSSSSSASAAAADSSLAKPLSNGSASVSQKLGSSDANYSAAAATHSAMAPPLPSPRPRPTVLGGSGNPPGIGAVPGGFTYNHGPLPPTPPPLPPFPIYQMPPNGYGLIAPPPQPPLSPDASPRELQYRGGYRGARPVGGFPSQAGNDRRSSNRRGNYGSHPRGDGSFHNNHGSRRDQDRGNNNARDSPVLNQRGPPRGYIRHQPPNALPFITMPPTVRPPFLNPMGFPEFQYFPTSHLDPYRGVPRVHPNPPAVMMPAPEPVSAMLVRQVEYYFSDENLIKDNYLKSNMDDQGWVPVSLIAGFPRVKKLMEDINQNNNLVDNIQFMLDSLRSSLSVEVQESKLRRRDEWIKWVNTSSGLPSGTGSKSADESNCNMLGNSMKTMSVGEGSASHDSVTVSLDTCSGTRAGGCMPGTSGQSSLPNGEYAKDSAPSTD